MLSVLKAESQLSQPRQVCAAVRGEGVCEATECQEHAFGQALGAIFEVEFEVLDRLRATS